MLTAVLRYGTSQLWIAPSLCGVQLGVEYEGHPIRFVIPDTKALTSRSDMGIVGERAISQGGDLLYAELLRVTVEVDLEGELTPELRNDDPTAIKATVDDARRVAEGLLDHLAQQLWTHGRHHRLAPFEFESGHLIADGHRTVGMLLLKGVITGPGKTELDESALQALLNQAAAKTRPPLPRLLLSSTNRVGGDARARIVLSAVAVEVGIKSWLREHTPAQVRPMLDVVLDNPREVSLAAVSLLDKTLWAAVGVSLREEPTGLYKRAERLFEIRNQIAHGGMVRPSKNAPPQEPDLTHASECEQTAYLVLDWLDALSTKLNDGAGEVETPDGG